VAEGKAGRGQELECQEGHRERRNSCGPFYYLKKKTVLYPASIASLRSLMDISLVRPCDEALCMAWGRSMKEEISHGLVRSHSRNEVAKARMIREFNKDAEARLLPIMTQFIPHGNGTEDGPKARLVVALPSHPSPSRQRAGSPRTRMQKTAAGRKRYGFEADAETARSIPIVASESRCGPKLHWWIRRW